MKTLVCSLTFAAAATLTAFAQGRVAFNNATTFNASDAITVGNNNMGSLGGLAGEGIGGDKYSVQLLWVAGTGYNQATFDAANPTYGVACTGVGSSGFATNAFFRNTGNVADGAGFFDAGQIPYPTGNSMPVQGWYTMQVLAWYNVGYSTYESARVGSANVGRSQLFVIIVTAAPGPPANTIFPGFTVGTIPEPSTLALAGLGAVAMLFLRRKRRRKESALLPVSTRSLKAREDN